MGVQWMDALQDYLFEYLEGLMYLLVVFHVFFLYAALPEPSVFLAVLESDLQRKEHVLKQNLKRQVGSAH